MYERFTNHTPHSFVTLSSTTKLGLGLPNKVMSTCELSKLELDETKKEQWARVFLVGFSSSLVRVLWVRLKRNKPGNCVIVSSMGCFIVQLTPMARFLSSKVTSVVKLLMSAFGYFRLNFASAFAFASCERFSVSGVADILQNPSGIIYTKWLCSQSMRPQSTYCEVWAPNCKTFLYQASVELFWQFLG